MLTPHFTEALARERIDTLHRQASQERLARSVRRRRGPGRAGTSGRQRLAHGVGRLDDLAARIARVRDALRSEPGARTPGRSNQTEEARRRVMLTPDQRGAGPDRVVVRLGRHAGSDPRAGAVVRSSVDGTEVTAAGPGPADPVACHTAAVLLTRIALAHAEGHRARLDREVDGAGADGLRLDGQVLGAGEFLGGSLLLLHTLIVELATSAGSHPLEVTRGLVVAADVDWVFAAKPGAARHPVSGRPGRPASDRMRIDLHRHGDRWRSSGICGAVMPCRRARRWRS
jgi:hypothetical protein